MSEATTWGSNFLYSISYHLCYFVINVTKLLRPKYAGTPATHKPPPPGLCDLLQDTIYFIMSWIGYEGVVCECLTVVIHYLVA